MYLYRSVISKKLMDDEMKENDLKNEYSIDEYTDIMDAVEDFVFSNIQDLVYLRLNQTEYKTVQQNITRIKQVIAKKRFHASGSIENDKLLVKESLEKHIKGQFGVRESQDKPKAAKQLSNEELKLEQ